MAVTPPRGLPSGYREVHRWVRQEEERCASRAELARTLGVSTHTLQRLLVDGDVPDFTRPQGRRLVLAWVRTLTTLAARFRQDPRAWIEGVGIAWDDRVERAAAAAVERRQGRPASASAAPDPLEAVRARARRGDAAPVEAVLVDRPFFADPLPDGRSFLQACVEMTIGAVDPAWGVRWRTGSPAEAAALLSQPGGEPHLVAGLLETAQLKARGIAFVRLPGWRVPLRALWVDRGGEPPVWEELTQGRPETARFLVRAEDPAETIVRRHWGAPPARVLVRDRSGAEALARELLEEMRRRPGGVVFVADGPTVDRVAELVEALDGFHPDGSARIIAPPPYSVPGYPLAIAVRAGAERWRELLEHAWREDLMGALRAETAALHAAILALGARSVAAAPDDVPAGPGSVTVDAVPGAGADFDRVVVQRLLTAVAEAAQPGRDRAGAWDRAIHVAHATVPDEWIPQLEAVALGMRAEAIRESGEPHRPFHAFCRSCATSLLHAAGKSPCYCRHCSDETGRLRTRAEVQKLLAEWMQAWQGGLSDEEAMERARVFMSTMPAWAGD